MSVTHTAGTKWAKLSWVVGGGVGALALAYLVRVLDGRQAWQALSQAEGTGVMVALGLVGLNGWAKGLRWKRLMGVRGRRVPLWDVTRALLVGQALNTFLPLRVGDVARIYLVGSDGVDRGFALGTVALEKVLDLWCYAFLVVALALWVPLASAAPSTAALLVGAGAATSGVLAIFLQRERLIRSLAPSGRLRRVPAAWRARALSVLESLEVLRHHASLRAVVGWSALVWLSAVLINVSVLWALHIPVPLIGAVAVLVLLQVAISFASVPGNLGIFEYLCIVALLPFGVGQTEALTFGVLLHAIVLIQPLAGLLAAWRTRTRGK